MTSWLRRLALACAGLVVATGMAIAQQLRADVNRICETSVGDKIGSVAIRAGKRGVTFKVSVKGLPKGSTGSVCTIRETAPLPARTAR